MRISPAKYIFIVLALFLLLAYSPEAATKRRSRNKDKDSLLTLLNAEYARVFERPGKREFREVKGPATFFHNGAYMFCDSAIWNVNLNQVEAYNNVKLVQDKTVVTSDNVIYYADDNVARFRGEVVEVHDKEKNTLRTRYLDYNTADSVAKFSFGGAMKPSKGEVIESDRGTYDAKTGICRFEDNVEMFTDSLFIKTTTLDYDTNQKKAYFGKKTQMWKDEMYMRGEYGWYQQDSGVVYFNTDVYMNNHDYEGWCDTMYYYQHSRRGLMRRNVQLLDSLNNTYFVSDAGNVWFDTVNNIYATLFLDPAAVNVGENTDNKIDTLFCRADTLMFYTQRVCDIPEELVQDSQQALQQVNFDAIGEAEKKALEKKEQERKEAIEKLPEYIAYKKRKELAEKRLRDSLDAVRIQAERDSLARLESLQAADSLAMNVEMQPGETIVQAEIAPPAEEQSATPGMGGNLPQPERALMPVDTMMPVDTLGAADSLAVTGPQDTTKLRFIKGYRHVLIYRTDIQARCDSLYFSQLDTLLRMYEDPVIWNENRHQLSGEEVIAQMRDNAFDRANIHGNAMIISQEDTVHFDQIKATEMLGYFNKDNTLRRYDALGGVNAMFYMQEDSVITILNSKQAQFMMVTMKNGVAEKLKYYEQINSDAYPVYNLPVDKQRLKGFNWRDDEKPKSRFDVTKRALRQSKRASYAAIKLPVFKRTDTYYQDYMKDIFKQIEDRAEQNRLEQARRDSIEAARQEAMSHMAADSTMGISSAFNPEGEIIIDSLATLKPGQQAVDDSSAVVAPVIDSRNATLDSLAMERDAAKARLDSLTAAISGVEKQPGIEGIDNHSDDGFVEVQLPKDGKKLTCKEKRALRKAARELRRQQRKLEREARKAEREALKAKRAAEREAKRAAAAEERAARKAAREAKRAAAAAEKEALKAVDGESAR